MTVGLMVVLGVTAAVLAVVLLNFFGPSDSDRPFWLLMKTVRDRLDQVTYWFINIVSIGLLGMVVVVIVMKLLRIGL